MSTDSKRLSGRIAIVTGAGQGIGKSYALGLARAGARVCVCDLEAPDAVVEAIQAENGEAIAVAADVTNDAALAAMVDKTIAAFGAPDILVNNAAIFGKLATKSLFDINNAEWDQLMTVNVRGTWQAIKACAPKMPPGSSIINISSGTVFKGSPFLLHYVSSKGAIIGLTRAAARELGPKEIRVNAIAPGLVLSENLLANPAFKGGVASAAQSRSLQRDSVPDDMVGAILFLASNDSAFVTGQTLVVDGGSVMH